MLRDLGFRPVYRTDEDNLLEDFYIPALKASFRYDRAVGFFSAGMLSIAAQGLSALIENDGTMRLIIGGELDEPDFRAIEEGYELLNISARFGIQIARTIDNIEDALFQRRLEALSWLVGSGRLAIKIALKQRGMYHEKIGILTDKADDKVVFVGSANETVSALLPDFNFESINVFEYWRPELKPHCDPYMIGFEKLWANRAKRTHVIDFPEAAKEKLVKIAKRARVPSPAIETELWNQLRAQNEASELRPSSLPSIPHLFAGEPFQIFPHQRQALEAWRANQLTGILALATGAGKTVTSIYGAVRIFEATQRLFVVIAVPYQNLADQWIEVLRQFMITPVPCYANREVWFGRLSELVTLFQTGAVTFACAVVVNRTLQSPDFQSMLKQIPGDAMLWIGDECHHHASPGLIAALPVQARSRLGLSATPEHYLDVDGNNRLTKYYGPVIYSYGLAEALKDQVLTPYYYYPVLVELTDRETEQYEMLTARISVLAAQRGMTDLETASDTQLQLLLFQRARLLGAASNKLVKLDKILSTRDPQPLTLFYCGDGSVEDDDSDESIRQIDAVSPLLHDRGWRNAHFTSRESRDERRAILDHFRVGDIDALVAIRCLDEGIDIPACRLAFILASSRNPKQFIQRRGRILRKSPNKQFAEIYDFLVVSPEGAMQNSQLERNLFVSELKRVAEFARLATNAGDVAHELSPVLSKYDLQHHLV